MIGGHDSARDTTCLREFRANLYSLVSAQPARGNVVQVQETSSIPLFSGYCAIRAQKLRNAWLAESRIERRSTRGIKRKVKKTTCARYLVLGKEES